MKIKKYQTLLQRFQYSRIFRAPLWLLKKLCLISTDPNQTYSVKMRLGHRMKIRPTQNYLKNILYSSQYHDENIFMIEPFIESGSTVLDIGANIGLYCCAYAKKFENKNLTIHAIEAVKNNFSLLEENIQLNRFSNIKSHHLALGAQAGELVLKLPDENFVGNAVGKNIFDEKDNAIEVKVPMVTLDQFAKNSGIDSCDFIKIDIEGAEILVFEGGREFISRFRPVIQCEYNKFWVENIGKSFKDFYEYFKDLDYEFAIEKKDSFEVIPSPESLDIQKSLVDLLFIPKERL